MKKFTLSFLSFFTTLVATEPLFFTPEMRETHLEGYSKKERALIEKDLQVIRSLSFDGNLPKRERPRYIATAGGPGARKSTILEQFLSKDLDKMVYVDPDQRGLKFMVNTYHAQSLSAKEIAKYKRYLTATRKGYDKWRGASNYIALNVLEEAFANGYDIAYGATSTGGHIGPFLDRVKEAGYEVSLILCYCSDAFRKKAIDYRVTEQKFYQTTPEDAVNKAFLFPQKMPIYFEKADRLYLFWSDNLNEEAKLAATVTNGKITVVDEEAMESFVSKYHEDRSKLRKSGINIPQLTQLVKQSAH